MAATDATPIPVKNQAYRVTFPILDNDGDLVTAATGLDSEVSKDAGTFADCSAEATEIASGSGMYYLDLTAAEMNADTVAILVKTTSSNAKTTPMVLYPNKSGGLAVNVTAWAGTATASGNVAIKNTLAKGTELTGFNDIAAGTAMTLTAPYDPAKTAAQAGNAMTLTAAYDSAKTAATQASVNTIGGYVDTEVGAIKTVTDKLDTALEVDGPVYRYTTNALEQAPAGGGGGTTDWTATERDQIRHRLGIDGTATAPSTGNPSLPDAADISQINAKLDAIDDFVDTEVGAIKAKTDQLTFTSGKVDANATITLTTTDFNNIADAVLKRDWTLLSGEAAYSLINAARMLRNKWDTTAGTLTVKKEDGSTTAWSRTLAIDPAAQPIVGAS